LKVVNNAVQDKFQNYISICFNPFTRHEAEKKRRLNLFYFMNFLEKNEKKNM
jgi:hypothetical protein